MSKKKPKEPKFPIKLDFRVKKADARRLRAAAANCSPSATIGVYIRHIVKKWLDAEKDKKR